MSFTEKYKKYIFASAVFFLSTTVILLIAIVVFFQRYSNRAEYDMYADKTEMMNSARRIISCAESGDMLGAYHSAELSALYASKAGMREHISVFRKIAEDIKSSMAVGDADLNTVREYVETGNLPGGTAGMENRSMQNNYLISTVEPESISLSKAAYAEKRANEIFGLENTLKPAVKSIPGGRLFTCRNAYAVINEKNGEPIEAGMSVQIGTPVLNIHECENISREFLGNFYSRETSMGATVCGIDVSEPGLCSVVYDSAGKKVSISVKMDTGKVIRVSTKSA